MRTGKSVWLPLAGLAVLLLSGCSANHYAVHEVDHLKSNDAEVIAVDAKQRFLISNVANKETVTVKKDGNGTETTRKVEKIRRFCAEYSPDVFSVLSQSASGKASFGQESDPKAVSAALQGAFSSGETGATIARTQTINMLKEMMYRTCERYMNGQIGDDEYTTIAARDQRIMTSILAIEQLTGSITPAPTVIAVSGESGTGPSSGDAMTILANAKKALAAAQEASEEAETAYAEFNQSKKCDELAAKSSDKLTAAEKTTLAECKEKQAASVKAAKDSTDANAYYEAQKALAGNAGGSSARVTAALLASPGKTEIDKVLETARLQAVDKVADTVERIVKASFEQEDETSFFCYRVMARGVEDNVTASCTDFLMKKVEYASEKLANESAKLRLETSEAKVLIAEYESGAFDKYWQKEDRVGAIDKCLKEASSVAKRKFNALKQASDKEESYKIFKGLPAYTQECLSK